MSCLYFTEDPQILPGEKFSQIQVPSDESKSSTAKYFSQQYRAEELRR